MEVITPIDLLIHSSNVTEALHSEFDYTLVATYTIGDRVYVSYQSDGSTELPCHQIYEALGSAANNVYPPTNPAKWVYVSSTNKYKMFDDYVNRQTESNAGVGYIETEIDSSKANRLCMANVDAGSVEITVTDLAHDDVWTKTIDMFESGHSTTWSTYYFGEFTYHDYKVVEIPPFLSATAKVKIIAKSSGGIAKSGILRAGKAFYVGGTEWDAAPGINSYSKKDTNVYGEVYLNPGSHSKRLEIDVHVLTVSVSSVQRKLSDLEGTVVFFNANNDTDQSALEVYGFTRSFRLLFSGPIMSEASVTIDGMI